MSELKKQINEEMKEEGKRLFFFQFKSTFFNEEMINTVVSLARDNGDNENDYLIFFLKLVCRALENQGYIFNEYCEIFTPRSLRQKLAFFPTGTKSDYELVERIVIAFEEAGIIEFTSSKEIYIPSVKYMAMSKKEDSERVATLRRKMKIYDQERKMESIEYKDEDFEILYMQCFSLLLLMNYVKREEMDLLSG